MQALNRNKGDNIDLKELFTVLKKRYQLVVIIPIIALITSGLVNYFVLSPIYETKSVLMLTQATPGSNNVKRNPGEEGLEGLMENMSRLPEMTIETYIGQLQNETVMNRVINKLKLDQQGYTAKSLAKSVEVAPITDTNLIEVGFTHGDPSLATEIVNTMAREFVDFMTETNEQQVSKSMEFLQKQAAATSDELANAMKKLTELEAQPRGVTTLGNFILTKSNDLSKFQSELLQARLQRSQHMAARQYTQARLKEGEIRNLQTLIDQLNKELSSLQAEYAQKKNALESAKKEVQRLEETDALIREKLNETQIGRSLRFGDTRVVVLSQADIPTTPIAPQKLRNILAAFTVGLLFSIALVFILNFFDETVYTPKDIEQITGLTVLGSVSFDPTANNGRLWR